MYEKSINNFEKIILADKSVSKAYVPYDTSVLKTLVFSCENPIGNIVVFGGYDSFIEEFYLPIKEFSQAGYNVYLFEGPGQGENLKKA